MEHKQHIDSLKDRLEKYRLKNQFITEKELEIENNLIEKEKLEKERESIRLEAEKQALILELQRVSQVSAKPTKPAKPTPVQAQSLFSSFGYPTMVTEKEAIDWLRNGF